MKYISSSVEQFFFNRQENREQQTRLPYLVLPDLSSLGQVTALRFLEWVAENPEGVISLPTGKTPEYFIRWTNALLKGWETPAVRELCVKSHLKIDRKPDLSGLHFVQIDEFYPIAPKQHNSFYNYVTGFYIKRLGLNLKRALLINCLEIALVGGRSYHEIFPDGQIDLSLRHRRAVSSTELRQQESIRLIDDWCGHYEEKIRNLGGIGFFLGGIGPDGHIAFNARGSDHLSTTRLTATNFETQAAAAGDLGGIEVSGRRLVITIGLGTITFNPQSTAIIFAAGEAKAPVVREALEKTPSVLYPATTLHKLPGARFYLTSGAAAALTDTVDHYYFSGEWNFTKTTRAIMDLCHKVNKYAANLTLKDLQQDRYTAAIPACSLHTVQQVIEATRQKILNGLHKAEQETFLHTGPHHDDIMLGIFPEVITQLREASNRLHFAVFTSGFTAVTNSLVKELLETALDLIRLGRIEMLNYPDFFQSGYLYKRDKDVAHYLNKVAATDSRDKVRGLCHRLIRNLVQIYRVNGIEELQLKIRDLLVELQHSYDGQKNSPQVQQLKGMIREFEEELIWAHFGVQVKDIEHLRLGFYRGEIFTGQPEEERDILPVVELFRRVKPTVISLAFDPEGSGPDTHFKVLQIIAGALKVWGQETDLTQLKICGYRNVWYRFHPAEAERFIPVSLNSMAVLQNSFRECYTSQVHASFPCPEHDGTFSELTQKIWVEQFKEIQLILGKDFFYNNPHPKLRATHGLVLTREMSVTEFLKSALLMEKSMNTSIPLPEIT